MPCFTMKDFPMQMEIFFEEYVNEAFFFHKKGEKGNRFGTARLFFSDNVCGYSRHIEKVKRWKIMISEDAADGICSLSKRKVERNSRCAENR